jgi:mRNA-degrading endonuclease toxin of MazEF toxin-antitoxin module
VTRGELWWCDFGADIGAHPCLVVSRTAANRRRDRAVVATVSTTEHGLPTEVAVGPAHGLSRDSIVDCEDLNTVTGGQLYRRIGPLDPPTLAAVGAGLRVALDLRQ